MFPFAPIWRSLYPSQVSSREDLLRIPQNYLLTYLSEVEMQALDLQPRSSGHWLPMIKVNLGVSG